MIKKEWVALVMAGGQGSRLGILTKHIAKPAVPFGGKYRIIDFTLSNCSNSGIDTVGVLTQYRPLVLNSYIGNGGHWDLDRVNGGITILPPHVKQMGGKWYLGTANAVYQNMEFIDQYQPNHLLVLSGDHVYKMDYSLMLDYHKEKRAAATIAVIEVPLREASGFGIMTCDHNSRIIEFEEKPKKPKSNLASMGVYIFDLPFAKRYLEQDELNPISDHDFGKNIIPAMVRAGEPIYAYTFRGYWKDVGTIESYWQANMDLLKPDTSLNLNDSQWGIYSETPSLPPHYLAPTSKVRHSLINGGCFIFGEVDHSVIFQGVSVGPGSVIKNSIVLPNAKIGANVHIENAIVEEGVNVHSNCRIVGKENGCQYCRTNHCAVTATLSQNIVIISKENRKIKALIS